MRRRRSAGCQNLDTQLATRRAASPAAQRAEDCGSKDFEGSVFGCVNEKNRLQFDDVCLVVHSIDFFIFYDRYAEMAALIDAQLAARFEKDTEIHKQSEKGRAAAYYFSEGCSALLQRLVPWLAAKFYRGHVMSFRIQRLF